VFEEEGIALTSITIGKGSNKTTDDHEKATDCNGYFTSPPICHIRTNLKSVTCLNGQAHQ
jgi:hypothetical protein